MAEHGQLRQSPVTGGRAKEYHVAVTQEQRVELEKRAAAEGVTVPRFLVEVALNRTPVLSKLELNVLSGIRQSMVRDRANLNQIAHRANVGGYDPDEHDAALASCQSTNQELVSYLRSRGPL
jgi:hypothetical protein